MIFVTIVLAITTVLFLATTGVAVQQKGEAEKAKEDAEMRAGYADARLQAAREALVPMAHAWDHVETRTFENMVEESSVLRHFLVATFRSIQDATGLDDLEMAEALEAAPEPPRRLPKYPQVPTYLASPEDVTR